MFMLKQLSLAVLIATPAIPHLAVAQAGPGLGVDATAEEVAEWDITIAPDGVGLPPGSGDARRGASSRGPADDALPRVAPRCRRCQTSTTTGRGATSATSVCASKGSLFCRPVNS